MIYSFQTLFVFVPDWSVNENTVARVSNASSFSFWAMKWYAIWATLQETLSTGTGDIPLSLRHGLDFYHIGLEKSHGCCD